MHSAVRNIFLLIVAFLPVVTHAQQFDWVHGGGGGDFLSPGQENEATYFMCTDVNKNIYAVSEVGGASAITADTFHVAGAYNNEQVFLITSYTCNGQMRWAKLISSTAGHCIPNGILADSLGHIYVAAYLENNTLHIGNDATITGQTHQHAAVMQFDTLGVYNWIRFVGDNNQPINGVAVNNVCALGPNNQVHYFCYLASGILLAPGVTSQIGVYDMTYDPAGNLLSATRLDIDSTWYLQQAVIDYNSNKLYVIGERDGYYVGVPNFITFAGAFDANRDLIWMDTTDNATCVFRGIAYDQAGHLYFSGSGGGAPFSFRGQATPAGPIAAVMKTDTMGNVNWLQYYILVGSSVMGYIGLTLTPNNLIAASGVFGGNIYHGSNDFHNYAMTNYAGQDPFLSILDTSGYVMSLKPINGDGFYDWSTSITSDKVGNIYIGGQVEDSIWAGTPPIPAYHTHGGNTDFFIMKYGVDCGCTSAPVANFSVAGTDTAHTKSFTYTGTTNGIDSVHWYFGTGGDTTVGMNPSHTFDTGYYEVCVTIYTSCGQDMHCTRVHVAAPEAVNNVPFQNLNASVYPNPAKDELKIVSHLNGSYKLMNISGSTLQQGTINSSNTIVTTRDLPTGMYLLQLTSDNGQSEVVKVVKE